ncbi:MAG: sigma-54-dependent Fis family transcriptional regulator, partial [Calditrichaeota bacterium]|nr:sigma-54-dependent Fis family transcriptional regulator [Calditrichota bacterium]
MTSKFDLLLVDDDDDYARDFNLLGQKIFNVSRASTGEEALERLKNSEPDAVILDLRLGAGMDGLETLKRIRAHYGELPVIMVSDYTSVETAVEAIKLGAFHYTSKHPNMKALHAIITRELRQISWKSLFLNETDKHFGKIIASSPIMKNIFKTIPKIAQSNANILIQGETGTGKELVARAIHLQSPRAQFPFVAINCSALPFHLLESELFGHEKGSFTGAIARKKGKFELADGGTILLDEIADLDYNHQAKLLRVIEEQKFTRVGGENEINVNVRIIAASNKNIQEEIKRGQFREDLFYRLNTIPLKLPPLRERKEDISVLVNYFTKSACAENKIKSSGFTNQAINKLRNYSWPGNIRELKSLIERTIIMHPDKKIHPEDVELGQMSSDIPDFFERFLRLPYPEARTRVLMEFKKIYIAELTRRSGGNITKAAQEAQI